MKARLLMVGVVIMLCSVVHAEDVEAPRAKLELASARWVFIRMEEVPPLRFAITNLQDSEIVAAPVSISNRYFGDVNEFVRGLAAGAQTTIEFPVDTTLRPGTYDIKAKLEIPGEPPYYLEKSFPVTIVPRPLPHRMPVVMWGHILKDEASLQQLLRLGFTHTFGYHVALRRGAHEKIWEAGEPRPEIPATNHMLNEALANGLTVGIMMSPATWARTNLEQFQKVNREGKFYEEDEQRDIVGLYPEVQQFCYNYAASAAGKYKNFPAFKFAMVHSELRTNSRLSFTEIERAAFRKHAGIDIPKQLTKTTGIDYHGIEDFPASRVIPDDYPMYVYLKWYWKYGDGYNAMNTAVVEGFKSTRRKDLWTWHDPAVRVPKVYGSGGAVDHISHWTYTYPDPLNIATTTDELLAMAAGSDYDQQVMKMTQIIWGREVALPSKEGEGEPAVLAHWETAYPDMRHITIPPMPLREAFWVKISRPIQGIMYFGYSRLIEPDPPYGGRHCTHPETQHELARLTHGIIEPLGPTLLQVPGVQSDVAYLQSAASEFFARRGTYGWGHTWGCDAHLVLQWAQLQPEIVFDETITERGLEDFKVLVMMDCDVLIQTIADKVIEFQNRGGIVVGDENLCPAITPDILLTRRERPKGYQRDEIRKHRADEDKAALQRLAAQLRQELDPLYTRYVDSSNPDVVTYYRRYGTTDYVFCINDHREFGTYVGQHKRMMENGLPSDAVITVNRPSGFVYDLVSAEPVPATAADGKLQISAHLEPCSGRLFMITEQQIAAVRIEGPQSAAAGDSAPYTISVVSTDGQPVDAVVPLKVDIIGPDARLAEFSGYYGAAGGVQQIELDFAANDKPGVWTVRVREAAAGTIANFYTRLERHNQ